MLRSLCRISRLYLVGFLFLPVFSRTAARANPALEGYADPQQFTAAVAELDRSDLVSVSSLGKSSSGREVTLLTIGAGKVHEKPGIVIVGNVQSAHLAGGELALRIAQQLMNKAANDEATQKLLERVTFYVIPRPDPDGVGKCFLRPYREPAGNARATDDDRDFAFGEDPPEDLNGDGWITQMRVEDASGTHLPHPEDARLLIPVDPRKNEVGKYRLYTEGRDNDDDGQFNEDAGDGVSLNRNFPFRYGAFQPHAGANAASGPETRALLDFLYDRPNIAVVFWFSPEDNLFFPWKPNPDGDKGKRKASVQGPDVTPLEYLAEQYRKTHGGKDARELAPGPGSAVEWGYFHFGRWSLAARGWWLPKGEGKSEEKRGAEDLNALRWFGQEKIDGFVAWQEIEHPDFPDKRVEVGGFKPFYRLNPPAKQLDALATKHLDYLRQLPDWFPRLEINDAIAEQLGGGVIRVTATAINRGFLPTMSDMGRINGEAYPLQMSLDAPKGAELLQGPLRMRVKRLEGQGGQEEKTWLLRFREEIPTKVHLRLWAPAVGMTEVEVEVTK
jgi:hypothetical protein